MKKVACIILAFVLLGSSVMSASASGNMQIYRDGFNPKDYGYPTELLKKIVSGRYDYTDDQLTHYKSYEGVHPRMYIDSDKLEKIRSQMGEGQPYYDVVRRHLAQADKILNSTIESWPENGKGTTNLHRPVGDNLSYLAIAYLITHDEKYFYGINDGCYGIKPVIETVCSVYPSWGVEQYNNDLVYAHIISGLALAWDYCQDMLEKHPELKTLMLNTVKERSAYLYNDRMTTAINWGHNHSMAQRFAFMVWAEAAFEEMDYSAEVYNPDVWLKGVLDYLIPSCYLMAQDGTWHEGVGYTSYELEFMLPCMELAKKFHNINLYTASSFYKNYKYAIIYNRMKSGNSAWMVPYGNTGERDTSNGTVTAYMHLLASEFGDSEAQYIAEDVITSENSVNWYDVLWYNPDVPKGEDYRSYLPATHYFDQEDTISVRSGWEGEASWLMAKCGPPNGHQKNAPDTVRALPYARLGSGHADADVGHFALMSRGEWIFKDDVYDFGYNNTETDHHNVLIMDGTGQIGDYGTQFMDRWTEYPEQGRHPHFYSVKETDKYFYAAADVTDAYNKETTGLKSWKRHFLYLKPDVLFIADEVEADGVHDMNLRFLPDITNLLNSDGTIYMFGQENDVKMYSLDTDGGEVSIDREKLLHTYPSTYHEKDVVNYRKHGNSWTNVVGITWRSGGDRQKAVSMAKSGKKYTFNAGKDIISLNLETGDVHLSEAGAYPIRINNMNLEFKVDNCDIIESSLYSGYRDYLAALGVDFKWYEDTETLVMEKDGFYLSADYKNEKFIYGADEIEQYNTADVIPRKTDGNLLLPVRFIAEALGYSVIWNDQEQTTDIVESGILEELSSSEAAGIFINGTALDSFEADKSEYTIDGGVLTDQCRVLCKSEITECSIEETADGFEISCINPLLNKTKTYKIKVVSPFPEGNVRQKVNYTEASSDTDRQGNTMDENMTTYWASPAIGDSIVFELEQEAELSGIMIAFSAGNTRKQMFEIYVSEDKENWKQVRDAVSSGTTVDFENFGFEPACGRYIKLVNKGNSSGGAYMTILEAVIYGKQ